MEISEFELKFHENIWLRLRIGWVKTQMEKLMNGSVLFVEPTNTSS